MHAREREVLIVDIRGEDESFWLRLPRGWLAEEYVVVLSRPGVVLSSHRERARRARASTADFVGFYTPLKWFPLSYLSKVGTHRVEWCCRAKLQSCSFR